ncbi:MAG: NAD(P)/FAD-dependent oxidoreductase, partial [Planctomycetes bacterium]|nr:NAD(P)/FAD-dependent oxidoreductase [Planctomycetota bacterium]
LDYVTDSPRQLKGLLRGFPSAAAQRLFTSQGCALYAEPLGKLFPRSDKAQDVLDALLDAVRAAEIPLVAPAEAEGLVAPAQPGAPWQVQLAGGIAWEAQRVVLATGGKSLPKTGSRGVGFALLRGLGHTVLDPVPALTPIHFAPASPVHELAGLTVPAVLTLGPRDASPEQLSGRKFRPRSRAGGSLLITHQGASGPAALDVSGLSGRAQAADEPLALRGDFWSLRQPDGPWSPYLELAKPPGASLPAGDTPGPPSFEAWSAAAAPLWSKREAAVANALAARLPKSLVQALLRAHDVDPSLPIKQLNTRHWRQVYLALTQADLQLTGVAGYAKAEVTGGGVLLGELGKSTLESKLAPGLFVCGEVVNVTGRLGGFNFQWAWSSGYAAGRAAAQPTTP